MSAPEIDPLLADEVARQKAIARANNARWGRMFVACSIASVALGVGAWFLLFREPMDREWGSACGVVLSAWLVGICLMCLFDSNPAVGSKLQPDARVGPVAGLLH